MSATHDEILDAIRRQANERDTAAKHHASEASRLTREAHELRTLAAQVERLSHTTASI